MANRFWVMGDGSWNDTTKWSTISGGVGGASVPTLGDAAYVDSKSNLGVPFQIRISATAQVNSFTVFSLTHSLDILNPVKFNVDNSYNIFESKVNYQAQETGLLVVGDYLSSLTSTYNSSSPIKNTNAHFYNTKLKSNLDVSCSPNTGYVYVGIYKNFYSNSKSISFRTVNDIFVTGSSLNESLTIVQNFSNSSVKIYGDYFRVLNSSENPYYNKILFDNCVISYSGRNANSVFAVDSKVPESISLPEVHFTINSLNIGGNAGPELNINLKNSYNTAYFPKVRVSQRSTALTRNGYTDFFFTCNQLCRFHLKELAISASALNRIILVGNNTKVFLESASLSQVVFTGINMLGFRELSTSFSASNIGEFKATNVVNTFIKFPPPKTVYWNVVAGGNIYSNSYTSATGGTVTTTWVPFPQDTAMFVDTGLNSSATISINNGKDIYFGKIDSSERTIPMTFHTSLSADLKINGGWITNSNSIFKGTQSFWRLTFHGTCTLNLVNSLLIPIIFPSYSNITFTCPLELSKNLQVQGATVNFNGHSLSASSLFFITNPNTVLNAPSSIILGGATNVLTLNTNFESTTFRLVNTTGNSSRLIQVNGATGTYVTIGGLSLEGDSASYSVRFIGNYIVNDLIYNKIGNIHIVNPPTNDPLVIKHMKLMGQFNGTTTASIKFSSGNPSLTGIIAYAGINPAESLSFVEFTRIVIEPRRLNNSTYRVFAGTRSSTTVGGNGPQYTDRPRINDVNNNSDVTSEASVKLITNQTSLNPIFKSTYKNIDLISLSLSNTSTYMATFPNYFSNNIKVGAKHELKIIRGN